MMLLSAFGQYQHVVLTLQLVITVLGAILHIIFAAGVAKDLSYLHKRGADPLFVPAYAWVLATLIFGLLALALYWLVHHSALAR